MKTPVLDSQFNKVAGIEASNFVKKTPTQLFSCEYCEIRIPILKKSVNGCFFM